jgi:DNA-binding response OmpR family regulator
MTMNRGNPNQPVLVVDDDPDVRRALGLVLRRAGCSVTLAVDGQECLKVVSAGFRGVILMDIMMPGLDGWATVQAMVEGGWSRGSLICMLTACVDPRPGTEGLEQHVFDYIVKPFDVEVLVDVVRLALSQLEP